MDVLMKLFNTGEMSVWFTKKNCTDANFQKQSCKNVVLQHSQRHHRDQYVVISQAKALIKLLTWI